MGEIRVRDYIEQVFYVKAQTREFNWKMPHQPLEQKEVCGTAFRLCYNKKTYFATCFHVIEDAFHIAIVSPVNGSEEFRCRVEWSCPDLDLAVIVPCEQKILHTRKKMGLRPWIFPFIRGNKIPGPNIGAVAYTVGFPLGQTHLKITKGVISGQQHGLFQTDAPVNGGNSGGPLVWDNRVIGITSSGYFFSQNVAYAIPVARLLRLIDYHEKHPSCSIIRFPRTWGASFAPPAVLVSSSSALDNSKDGGVEVREVFPRQLMSKTSIRKGDIILRIDGIPVSSLGEMPIQWMNQNTNIYNFFFHTYLGQEIRLDYLSGKKKRTESITILPETGVPYRRWIPEHETIPYIYFCGLVVVPFCQNIMSKRFKYLKLWENNTMDENPLLVDTKDADDPALLGFVRPKEWGTGRVFISNILKGSIVEKRHLIKIGDIIDTVNGVRVPTIEEARRALDRAMGGEKEIRITMQSGSSFRVLPRVVREEEARLEKIFNYTSAWDSQKKISR